MRRNRVISDRLTIDIPSDLVNDSRVPLAAKALYMTITSLGACSLKELSSASGANRDTVRRLVGILAAAEWVVVGGNPKRRSVAVTRPKETQMLFMNHLRQVRSSCYPAGENLSRLVLDVEVADDRHIDNARLSFLQSRETGEYLELDRWWYERRVGEEYEGIQHFQATNLADQEKVKQIQARDAMKAEMCREKDIPLMIVTEDDLSVDGIAAKIPPELPRARFNRKDPYVRSLDEVCQEYVASCKRLRLRDARERAKKEQRTPGER